VERRRRYLVTKRTRSHAKVRLEQLADVHTRWHTERVQHHVDRGTVFHEWHVLYRQNAGDHALVTVAASQLVANADFAQLSNENLDLHQYASLQLMTILAAENLHANDFAATSVVHALRGVADVFGFFTEDSAEEA